MIGRERRRKGKGKRYNIAIHFGTMSGLFLVPFTVTRHVVDYTLFLIFRIYEIKEGFYSAIHYGNPFGLFLARFFRRTYGFPIAALYIYDYIRQKPSSKSEYPNSKFLLGHMVLMFMELGYLSPQLSTRQLLAHITFLCLHYFFSSTAPVLDSMYLKICSLFGRVMSFMELREIVIRHETSLLQTQDIQSISGLREIPETAVALMYLAYCVFAR
jgi:hypothetical protein